MSTEGLVITTVISVVVFTLLAALLIVLWVDKVEPWYSKRKLLKRIKKLPKYIVTAACDWDRHSIGDIVYKDDDLRGLTYSAYYYTIDGILLCIDNNNVEKYRIKKNIIGGKLI